MLGRGRPHPGPPPSGSIGRDIAYIKYLDQKDLRGSRPGTNLSTVPIYHAIGMELGYDHCVTNEEYSDMEDKYDYETFRTITTKLPDADRVNMRSPSLRLSLISLRCQQDLMHVNISPMIMTR